MPKWQNLWEERGQYCPTDDVIELNGFDHGAGKLSKKQVEFLLNKIKSSLVLTRDDLLLEAGCGAGMLLKPLSSCVRRVIGADYATSMLKRAKTFMPDSEVIRAEIGNLPFRDNTFDKIVCFSVFQYLPSLEYAQQTLNEFFRTSKPGGRIFIGDVPDEDKKLESLNYRKKILIKPKWSSSFKTGLKHMFYKKQFFHDISNTQNVKCEISQEDIPRYINALFRFNVLLKTV